MTTWSPGVHHVSVVALRVSPQGNDRTHFDHLERLAESIRENGQITPVLVRPVGDALEIVAGESRTRAIRDILGWSDILVDIRELSDEQAWSMMLDENTARADLDPIDEARGMRERMNAYGWSIAEMARRCGRSPGTVADRLQLLALCDEVAEMVRRGTLPVGRARLLAQLEPAGQRAAVRMGMDLTAEGWGRLVSKLVADQDQAGLFSMDGLQQQVYDTATSRYIDDVESELEQDGDRDTLVGPGEIAERLGVTRNAVAQWRKRYETFPQPLTYLSDGRRSPRSGESSPGLPVWQWGAVYDWARETGRVKVA